MTQNRHPSEVDNLLGVYGERVRIARMRRRWTQAELAERMGVERRTVARLESGSAGVGLGAFLTALWILDLQQTARDVADPASDSIGLFLEKQHAPKRARRQKEKDLDF